VGDGGGVLPDLSGLPGAAVGVDAGRGQGIRGGYLVDWLLKFLSIDRGRIGGVRKGEYEMRILCGVLIGCRGNEDWS
jgi:hypothetical protein